MSITATLHDIIVTKTGDTSDETKAVAQGINSALLVQGNVTANVSSADIVAEGLCANGVFAYGEGIVVTEDEGTTANISNSSVITTQRLSSGLVTSDKGVINATNLRVLTEGEHSYPITCNENGGLLKVYRGTYTSSGVNSPVVYSKGEINIDRSILNSSESPAIVVEGVSKTELTSCDINVDNRTKYEKSIYHSAILIHNTDGDSSSIPSLAILHSTITNSIGRVFHITNTTAELTLENVSVINNDNLDILFSLANDGWTGVNNKAKIVIKQSQLSGKVVVDNTESSASSETSSLDLILSENTTLETSLNSIVGNKHRGSISLTIDNTSTLSLTATSYVDELIDEGTILLNGFKLYVNGIEWKEQEPNPDPVPEPPDDDTDDSTLTKLVITHMSTGHNIDFTLDANSTQIYSITQGGTYSIKNTAGIPSVVNVSIKIDTTSDVVLNLDNVDINNSTIISNLSVVQINSKGTITFNTIGTSTIKGFKARGSVVPLALVSNTGQGNIVFNSNGVLNLIDGTPNTYNFNNYSPTDGVITRGSITLTTGTLLIQSTGRGLVGGSNIVVSGGDTTVISYHSDGLHVSNGDVSVAGGKLNVTSYGTGIYARSGKFTISAGTANVAAEGDGIRAENASITGGSLSVSTSYDFSGVNFYVSNAISGSDYNVLKESGTNRIETINYYPGSHKGLNIGTEGRTYSYKSVSPGSKHKPGEIYTDNASGSLNISGGTLTVDTTATGIRYTSREYEYIIGSPDYGIHCSKDIAISGGTVTVKAADNGIDCDNRLDISSGTVKVNTAFQGLKGQTIAIGVSGSSGGPKVYATTNDDGVNSTKRSYSYSYEDESEKKFVKTVIATSTNNNAYVYSGDLIITINDTGGHTIPLNNASGTSKLYSYNSDGNGVKCNGSFYAYGGNVRIYGTTGNTTINCPVAFTTSFTISQGTSFFAVGMNTNELSLPTSVGQPYLTGDNTIKPGSFRITGTNYNFGEDIPTKASNYKFFLYSDSTLEQKTAYTVTSGGVTVGTYTATTLDD